MSQTEPNPPAEPQDGEESLAPQTKPDWLVGAEASTRVDAEGVKSSEATAARQGTARLKLVEGQGALPDDEASAETSGGPGPWKAAASSIPRLRQQPAASAQPEASEAFTGFAQDAMMAKSAPGAIGRGGAADLLEPGAAARETPMALAEEPPIWEQWLEQLRALPRGAVIAVAAVLVVGVAVFAFWPRGGRGASLAQIRQHPEAFEGRLVRVSGRAGEAFAVGGSYVFNLYQGRDTIVVYSRTQPPAMREKVKVSGTVSIGYLDGVPRVALLESPAAP